MKIGVHATNSRGDGGQYQFLATCLDALAEAGGEDEYFLFHFRDHGGLARKHAHPRWRWIRLPGSGGALLGPRVGSLVVSGLQRLLRPLRLHVSSLRPAPRAEDPAGPDPIARFLAPFGLDLMLFPVWTEGCWRWGVPYVFAVHDLQHRLQPQFPEVSIGGAWAWRERLFSGGLAQARRILVDSEEGKRNVLEHYPVDAARVSVLPYTFPAAAERTQPGRQALAGLVDLPSRYFLYPAQFWPHKNQYRVVEAVGMLKRRGIDVNVVLTGGEPENWGVLEACRALAASMGVSRQVLVPGYVSDEALAELYATAVGLVMPTFFGPTNIPYLEAFQLGCPVVASDLPGIREQVGEAALLVDPRDTRAIADAMEKLWTDEALRARLAAAGRTRVRALGRASFAAGLLAALRSAA
jgi:glycosyltransferase involved in cell wall biosynthesis